MENKIEYKYKTLYSYKEKSEMLLNNSLEVIIEEILKSSKDVEKLIEKDGLEPKKEVLNLLANIREFELCNNIKKQLDQVIEKDKEEINFFK